MAIAGARAYLFPAFSLGEDLPGVVVLLVSALLVTGLVAYDGLSQYVPPLDPYFSDEVRCGCA